MRGEVGMTRGGRTTLTMSSMMSRLRAGSTPSLGLGASIAIFSCHLSASPRTCGVKKRWGKVELKKTLQNKKMVEEKKNNFFS